MAVHTKPKHGPPGAIRDLAQLGRLFDREQLNPQSEEQQQTTVVQQLHPLPENSILGAQPSMAVLEEFHVQDVTTLPDSDTVHVVMRSGPPEPQPEQQTKVQPSAFSFTTFGFHKDSIMTTATNNTTAASTTATAAAPVAPQDLLQRALAGDAAAAAEIAKMADEAKKAKENGVAVASPSIIEANKIEDLDVFSCNEYIPEEARSSALAQGLSKLEKINGQVQSNFKAVGNRLSGVEARLAALESAPRTLNLRQPELSMEDRVVELGWQAATGVALGAGVTAGVMLINSLLGGSSAPATSEA